MSRRRERLEKQLSEKLAALTKQFYSLGSYSNAQAEYDKLKAEAMELRDRLAYPPAFEDVLDMAEEADDG